LLIHSRIPSCWPWGAATDTPYAAKHDLAWWPLLRGFRQTVLQCSGRLVSEEDWARIREFRYRTRRSARAAAAGPGG